MCSLSDQTPKPSTQSQQDRHHAEHDQKEHPVEVEENGTENDGCEGRGYELG